MPFDNAVTNREAQPRTVSAFGGEEWIKNLLSDVLRHSCPGVGKFQTQATALPFATKCQPSTFRHSVNSVNNQVYKHLAKFGGAARCKLTHFGIQRDFVVKPAKSGFVFPTRPGDLNGIV